MPTTVNVNSNYEDNLNILNENIKLYTKKVNIVLKRVYESCSLQYDDFFMKIIINIFFLSDKGLKNKFINIATAIQIINNLNNFDDEMILKNDMYNDDYKYIIVSQCYYNIALKLFYENCSETIGIFQKTIENKIHSEIMKKKNINNYKMTISDYINQVDKRWGNFWELNSLVIAYLGKLNKDKTKIVREFSHYVGIAYGIKKDMSKLEYNTKKGIITMPIILLLAKSDEQSHILKIIKNKKDIDFNKLQCLMKKYNTIIDTELVIKSYIEKALNIINEIDGRQELKKIVYDYFMF